MLVNNEMVTDGSSDYYDDDFRNVLESHLQYFRTLGTTSQVSIAPNDTGVYDKNLFGFLMSRKIKPCYHWFIMRLNNMFSPTEFTAGVDSLLLPDDTSLDKVRQSWNSSKSNVLKS